MITLTDTALQRIKEIAEEEGITNLTVRASVRGEGCSGFMHDLQYVEQTNPDDEVVEFGEVKLVVDGLSFHYLENTTIDWLETPFGGGFKFISPDITGTCACGNSVSY